MTPRTIVLALLVTALIGVLFVNAIAGEAEPDVEVVEVVTWDKMLEDGCFILLLHPDSTPRPDDVVCSRVLMELPPVIPADSIRRGL